MDCPSSRHGGKILESAFKDQQNVSLVRPRDAQALALAIQSLIRDPALQQRLRKGAAQLADEWFSWERAVERTIQTFRLRPPGQMDVLRGSGRVN
jgi:glycosyltransferase involved in cell wall biosynthesis